MTWNDGATLPTCHCSSCDAPAEPACIECKADGIDLDDFGVCAGCRPSEEETFEAYDARMQAQAEGRK